MHEQYLFHLSHKLITYSTYYCGNYSIYTCAVKWIQNTRYYDRNAHMCLSAPTNTRTQYCRIHIFMFLWYHIFHIIPALPLDCWNTTVLANRMWAWSDLVRSFECRACFLVRSHQSINAYTNTFWCIFIFVWSLTSLNGMIVSESLSFIIVYLTKGFHAYRTCRLYPWLHPTSILLPSRL